MHHDSQMIVVPQETIVCCFLVNSKFYQRSRAPYTLPNMFNVKHWHFIGITICLQTKNKQNIFYVDILNKGCVAIDTKLKTICEKIMNNNCTT